MVEVERTGVLQPRAPNNVCLDNRPKRVTKLVASKQTVTRGVTPHMSHRALLHICLMGLRLEKNPEC